MPIPWSAIMRYADRYCGGSTEQQERLLRYITVMDQEFCRIQNNKIQQQMKLKRGKTVAKPRRS